MEYTLEKPEVYQLAEAFSGEIWEYVVKWKGFEKDTVGKQMVRAADSISANIAEGYGRYFYKESRQFYFYARGQSRKLNHGCPNVKEESLFRKMPVIHCFQRRIKF